MRYAAGFVRDKKGNSEQMRIGAFLTLKLVIEVSPWAYVYSNRGTASPQIY